MSGEVGDLFQAYTCPLPEGNVILSEEFIEPTAIKVNLGKLLFRFLEYLYGWTNWNHWTVVFLKCSSIGSSTKY